MFVCWNFCPYWADLPPYRNRSLHIINADKALYRIEIYRNCIKIHQNDLVQKDIKKAPKIWRQNGAKNVNTSRSLLCIRFVAVAFRSEEELS